MAGQAEYFCLLRHLLYNQFCGWLTLLEFWLIIKIDFNFTLLSMAKERFIPAACQGNRSLY